MSMFSRHYVLYHDGKYLTTTGWQSGFYIKKLRFFDKETAEWVKQNCSGIHKNAKILEDE